jgi:methionine synthase II (cobalamin-independent)
MDNYIRELLKDNPNAVRRVANELLRQYKETIKDHPAIELDERDHETLVGIATAAFKVHIGFEGDFYQIYYSHFRKIFNYIGSIPDIDGMQDDVMSAMIEVAVMFYIHSIEIEAIKVPDGSDIDEISDFLNKKTDGAIH